MKLCDFGSATTERVLPDDTWTHTQRGLVEEEVGHQGGGEGGPAVTVAFLLSLFVCVCVCDRSTATPRPCTALLRWWTCTATAPSQRRLTCGRWAACCTSSASWCTPLRTRASSGSSTPTTACPKKTRCLGPSMGPSVSACTTQAGLGGGPLVCAPPAPCVCMWACVCVCLFASVLCVCVCAGSCLCVDPETRPSVAQILDDVKALAVHFDEDLGQPPVGVAQTLRHLTPSPSPSLPSLPLLCGVRVTPCLLPPMVGVGRSVPHPQRTSATAPGL